MTTSRSACPVNNTTITSKHCHEEDRDFSNGLKSSVLHALQVSKRKFEQTASSRIYSYAGGCVDANTSRSHPSIRLYAATRHILSKEICNVHMLSPGTRDMEQLLAVLQDLPVMLQIDWWRKKLISSGFYILWSNRYGLMCTHLLLWPPEFTRQAPHKHFLQAARNISSETNFGNMALFPFKFPQAPLWSKLQKTLIVSWNLLSLARFTLWCTPT